MPRIPDEFLDCSVYLYPSHSDAVAGEQIGGSGFLVSVPLKNDPKKSFAVAVTNRHVIESGNTVVRLNNEDGRMAIADMTELDWILHPSGIDLSVAPIGVRPGIQKYKHVAYDALLSREVLADQNIGIGDETFLIGRFVGHDGKQTNKPSARFGNIAQSGTSILRDREVANGADQESFIIESRSIAGFSGSPVFVFIPPFAWSPGRNKRLEARYFGPCLLGVDWCNFHTIEPMRDPAGQEIQSGYHTRSTTGFMGVIPAWHLKDLLDSDELWSVLGPAEEKAMKKDAGVQPNVAIINEKIGGSDEEFERLIGVTGHKVDQARDTALKKALSSAPKPRSKKG